MSTTKFTWEDIVFNLGKPKKSFFNKYVITPNKKHHGPERYLIQGKTNAGRRLRLVFEDFGQNTARIFTGWDI